MTTKTDTRYTWDWTIGRDGFVIRDNGHVMEAVPSSDPERHAADVLEHMTDGCRLQVTSHGAGMISVQVFSESGKLLRDLITRRR